MEDWNGDGRVDSRDYYDDLGGAWNCMPEKDGGWRSEGSGGRKGCVGCAGAAVIVLIIAASAATVSLT